MTKQTTTVKHRQEEKNIDKKNEFDLFQTTTTTTERINFFFHRIFQNVSDQKKKVELNGSKRKKTDKMDDEIDFHDKCSIMDL